MFWCCSVELHSACGDLGIIFWNIGAATSFFCEIQMDLSDSKDKEEQIRN